MDDTDCAFSISLRERAGVRGYGHLSLVPTWLTSDHCRYDPRGGDHAHLTSSQACVRPTPYRACPLSPRNMRLGRLSPRRRTWSHKRRARSGGVSHPCERLPSRLQSLPPSLPKSPFPRPAPQGTPERPLPSPILRHMSSTSQSHAAPCSAVLQGAPARQPLRAGRHKIALGEAWPPAGGAGRLHRARSQRGGAKMPFILSIRIANLLHMSPAFLRVCKAIILDVGDNRWDYFTIRNDTLPLA
jgi:hypothetical protein